MLADVAAQQNVRLMVVDAGERGKLACRLIACRRIGGVADLGRARACNVFIVRAYAGLGAPDG